MILLSGVHCIRKSESNENYLQRFDNVDVRRTREVRDGVLTRCNNVQISRDGSTNVSKIFDSVHRFAAIQNVELDNEQNFYTNCFLY